MDPASKSDGHLLIDPVTDQDHSVGPRNAPITIVEYGDYECPDCLNAVPILREVRHQLGDRVRFIFRHFPLSGVHPHASTAAEAAEAASDQGKFWEMHEALFHRQKQLGEVDFGHLALNLGLEIYKFEVSRAGERHRQHIKADYDAGRLSGVHKTPTLFINGRRYDGAIEAKAIITAAETGPEK